MHLHSMRRLTWVLITILVAASDVAWLRGSGIATKPPTFKVLHQFMGGSGANVPVSASSLIQGSDGFLYGTLTPHRPDDGGAVIRMSTDGEITVLHTFTGEPADGWQPRAPLIEASDGNFYGTTARGGSADGGTVFRMAPDGTVTIVHSFSAGEEGFPGPAALIQGTDGELYGTTPAGGTHDFGAAFKMSLGGVKTFLHSFTRAGGEGGRPDTALEQGDDGNFYGTTLEGGLFSSACHDGDWCGTIFRMTPSGAVSTIHAFTGADGHSPNGLVHATDGNFYGTTAFGGALDDGTIFKITPAGDFTTLHTFNAGDVYGAFPLASLAQGQDGHLYGTTSWTVFRVTFSGAVALHHRFVPPGAGFSVPKLQTSVLQASGGEFYGTTDHGGCFPSHFVVCHGGMIFRLRGVMASGDDLVADFGASGGGVFLMEGTTQVWTPLTSSSAARIVTGDLDGNGIDEVIGDFGPAHGIWIYFNNATWVRLHGSTASRMIAGDFDGDGQTDLAIDFPGFGIWIYANNQSWSRLHELSANHFAVGDLDGGGNDDLIIDFPGHGIWAWLNATSWRELHTSNSRRMVVGDFDVDGRGDLVAEFEGDGLWSYSSRASLEEPATWGRVHTLNGSHLAVGDVDGNGQSDLAVDFGLPHGVWIMRNSVVWSQLHEQTFSQVLTADTDGNGQADVVLDTGGSGIWERLNDATWFQAHGGDPRALAAGHITGP